MKWRFIDTGVNSGPMNMAIDEALLTSKAPVLRFYRWKPACLSIGYFQSIKNINFKNLKKYKGDIVRRPTGGNAVLHDKELTYSVIIDEKKMPKSVIESYKIISKGLMQGLKNLGLDPKMNEDVKKEDKSAICFNDPSWYEIVVNGKKIIGSAQKRINGKLLQHGAVLIGIDIKQYCSSFNNCNEEIIKKVKQRMTSINDELKNFALARARQGTSLAGCRVAKRPKPMHAKFFSDKINYETVKEAMKKGFEVGLNIKLKNSKLTKEELRLAKELERNKYSTKEWNYSR